ncbi:uncharacterized protein METZ01_LOCUS168066 [marine metagenome]|uniref:YtkA-like domain-containing protein n=1 Tax=marine metagenome TaxID=408172 RepID=A0A382BP83_9ZZZZ
MTLAVLVVVLLLFAPLASVAAQQEDPLGEGRGVDVVAGPHAVRVFVINSNLAAGFLQMALFITDANTGETVSDASVVLKANNEDQAYEGWATALNSPSMPERYDVRMNLGSTGEWTIDVDVSSSLGQGGTRALTLDVPALSRYTNGSLVFFGIFAAMMLGLVYLFWSTKRQNRRRREAVEVDVQGEP